MLSLHIELPRYAYSLQNFFWLFPEMETMNLPKKNRKSTSGHYFLYSTQKGLSIHTKNSWLVPFAGAGHMILCSYNII